MEHRWITAALFASALLSSSIDAQLSQAPGNLRRALYTGTPGKVRDVAPSLPTTSFTTVIGKVVADDQSPVDGATVLTNHGFSTTTDAAGVFVLVGHPVAPPLIDVDVEGVVVDTFGFSDDLTSFLPTVTGAGTIVVDVDTDADGLPDWYETNVYSTLPLVDDTDGDGYLDGVEVRGLGTDPTEQDGDGDGFGDLLEIALGTDPNAFDVATTINGTLKIDTSPSTTGTLHLAGIPETLFSASTDGSGFYQFPPWPAALTPVQVVGEDVDPNLGAVGASSAPTATQPGTVTAIADIVMAEKTGEPLYLGPEFGLGIAVGDEPVDVAIGDLNGDLIPDLAVVNKSDNNVIVLPGVGGGFLGRAVTVAANSNPDSVVIGDFDQNGIADLAVANDIASGTVSVMLGTGGGSFGAPTSFSAGTNPVAIASGLFDNDALPDLVVANPSSNQVSVLLGTGSGNFGTATTFSVGTDPQDVAIGTLDGDSDADLAVANAGSDNVTVLLGDGTGGFSAATNSPFAVGTAPNSLAIGNLNAGGAADIAVANEGSDDVTILLGDGAGDFTEPVGSPYAVGDGPVSLGIDDMNLDGSQDIVVANANSQDVSILPGFGDGTFATAVDFDTANSATAVAIGDLDLDGLPDLAIAEPAIDNVALLLGIGASITLQASTIAMTGSRSSVAIADVDIDGLQDIVAAGQGSVSVLLGTGGGGFGLPTDFSAVGYTSLQVADLSQDGLPDIVVGSGNSVHVLLGTGGGAFGTQTPHQVGSGTFVSLDAVVIEDIDVDGLPDIVASHIDQLGPRGVYILSGTGSGGFGPPVLVVPVGVNDLAVLDMNLDGLPDLITNQAIHLGQGGGQIGPAIAMPPSPNSMGTFAVTVGDVTQDGIPDVVSLDIIPPYLVTWQGTGNGTLGDPVSLALFDAQVPYAIADLNADGLADIAMPGGNLSVFLGLGGGNFGTPLPFSAGTGSAGLAVSDLNQDGLPDVVVANAGSNDLTIFLHQ